MMVVYRMSVYAGLVDRCTRIRYAKDEGEVSVQKHVRQKVVPGDLFTESRSSC